MRWLIEAFWSWWCYRMHTEITRPINGEYVCLECGRRYGVPWEQKEPVDVPEPVTSLAAEV